MLVVHGDHDDLALEPREDDGVLEAIDEHAADVDVFGAGQPKTGVWKLSYEGESLANLSGESWAEIRSFELEVAGGPGGFEPRFLAASESASAANDLVELAHHFVMVMKHGGPVFEALQTPRDLLLPRHIDLFLGHVLVEFV